MPERYNRVLLQLSGEVFGGGGIGVDADVVSAKAREIAEIANSGVQVAVVVGGGNFFRGAELQQHGMQRDRADYMGMLGTVMNCLALQDFCEKAGVDTAFRQPSRWARLLSLTSRARPSAIWRRDESSYLVLGPECRISRPTPSLLSEP